MTPAKWKCPVCRTWVTQPINIRCAACAKAHPVKYLPDPADYADDPDLLALLPQLAAA